MNVYLKNQTEEHVRIFFEASSDSKVSRWMYRHSSSLQEALKSFRCQDEEKIVRRVIYADNCYIGDVWATFTDDLVLLSCCIFDMDYWNRGVATRAVTLFLELLKGEYNVSSAGAFLYAENKGSQKVLEKLGFVRIKTFEENQKTAFLYLKKW